MYASLMDKALAGNDSFAIQKLISNTRQIAEYLILLIQRNDHKTIEFLFSHVHSKVIMKFMINNDHKGLSPLQVACLHGHSEIATLLLQKGANPDVRNDFGGSLLHLVVYPNRQSEENIMNMTEKLLDIGMNINSKDYQGRTPLYIACRNQLFRQANFLLEKGAATNVRDNFGNTVLLALNSFICDSVDKRELFVKILKEGVVDINEKNTKGETTLHVACRKGQTLKMINFLLQNGAQADISDKLGNTPLHTLLLNNANLNEKYSDDELRTLIENLLINDLDINSKNESEDSALVIACRNRLSLKTLNLLLEYGAHPNVFDKFGDSPLHILIQTICDINLEECSYNNYFNIIIKLMEHGLNINSRNHKGHTALDIALWCDKVIVTKFLLEIGARIDVDYLFLTDFTIPPYSKEKLEFIAYLMKNEDKIKWKHDKAQSLILFACQFKRYELAEYLLTLDGVNTNIQNEVGQSPLQLLLLQKLTTPTEIYSNLKLFVKLVKNGCDINSKDIRGNTPLHYACEIGRFYVVLYLLKEGANVNEINNAKQTPLHLEVLKKKSYSKKRIIDTIISGVFQADSEDYHFKFKNIMEALLEKKSDVNAQDYDGNLPLHYACVMKNEEAGFDLMKKKLVEVNTRNKNGETPLLVAVQKGLSCGFIDELIGLGADLDISDLRGETPLLAALRKNYADIADLLVKKNAELPAVDFRFLRHEFSRNENVWKCVLEHGPCFLLNMEESVSFETKIFKRYFIMLQVIKCFNGKSTFSYERPGNFLEDCVYEVHLMNNEKIEGVEGTKYSIYYIMRKTYRELINLTADYKIVEYVESKNFEEYVIYGNMIVSRIRRARYRYELLEKCFKILQDCMNLPDGCINEILFNFSNKDLKILMQE